jgi:hypothetical protein
MAVFVLNTSILTSYGKWEFTQISAAQAAETLSNGFVSAVGHAATAEILTRIIGT